MSGIVRWVASSGVVQGVIIGATLAFLTTCKLAQEIQLKPLGDPF
jgi:hypothetical protein